MSEIDIDPATEWEWFGDNPPIENNQQGRKSVNLHSYDDDTVQLVGDCTKEEWIISDTVREIYE